MTSFGSIQDILASGNGVRPLWQDMLRSLGPFVPHPLRWLFSASSDELICRLYDKHRYSIVRRRLRPFSNPEEIVIENDITSDQAYKHLMAAWQGSGPLTTLAIDVSPSLCLVRYRKVPRQARNRIKDILSLDLQRLSPFKSDDVLLGHATVSDHNLTGEDNLLSVCQVVLKRESITPIQKVFASHKSQVSRIYCRPDDTVEPIEIAVPACPEQVRLPTIGYLNSITAGLAGVAFLMILATAGTAIWQQNRILKSLDHDISVARKAAIAQQKKRASKKSIKDRISRFRLYKVSHYTSTEVWHEITRLLPPDAWLSSLNYEKRRVMIDGFSPASEKLISLFADSKMFSAARFRSGVVRDAVQEADRFQIELTLAPRISAIKNAMHSKAAPANADKK